MGNADTVIQSFEVNSQLLCIRLLLIPYISEIMQGFFFLCLATKAGRWGKWEGAGPEYKGEAM